MGNPKGEFLVSTEEELLTTVSDGGRGHDGDGVFRRFLSILFDLAPSLPGPGGVFNAYGRVYVDTGQHVELAASECDSPYQVPSIVERQHVLVGRALARLANAGPKLMLANNNHSGLLHPECPVWGSHENYLCERNPEQLGDRILPFLVTRIYGGAGGVLYPSGNFLAGVRALRMKMATGGSTTSSRAIHSTCRNEPLMGPSPGRYRYHLILGDGHRSHFNHALQFGATALALKAILYDKPLRDTLRNLTDLPHARSWVRTLKVFNVLAQPGKPIRIDPAVIRVQRLYLEAARRYHESLPTPPDWIPRTLQDWGDTLDALERMDLPWLAARLDAFMKYKLFGAILRERGKTWKDLPGNEEMFSELALVDHSYHEFGNSESAFRRLEHAGLLEHRVDDNGMPGHEDEPWVPDTTTRARARARFIREHRGQKDLIMDWSYVRRASDSNARRLDHPFAEGYGDWTGPQLPGRREPRPAAAARRSHVFRLAEATARVQTDHEGDAIRQAIDEGRFEDANTRLSDFAGAWERISEPMRSRLYRYKAWVQARRGYMDGDEWLERAHGPNPVHIDAILDHCAVLRYSGLGVDRRIDRWIDAGFAWLDQSSNRNTPEAAVLREHAGYVRLRAGRPEEALRFLEGAATRWALVRVHPRNKGRILATLGETHRVLGERRRARSALRRAELTQRQHCLEGDLSEFTLASLAKLERRRSRRIEWLREAKESQEQARNWVGLVRTLFLEARLFGDEFNIESYRRLVDHYVVRHRHLFGCPLVRNVFGNWEAWVRGDAQQEGDDEYWGM